MQHQQQVGGGGPPPLSRYGGGAAAEMVISDEDQKLGDLGIAEAASPISSRPPAPGNSNFEEMIQATAEAGGSSGNRWPRQETLALLQIRSEMDAAFRDATLKGPLWEQVSRKLAELGYHRNAKKCKEKFENVHKYYKRTKEGRGGRQDGKSYKFFSQLEALNHNIATGGVQALPRIAPPPVSLPPPPPALPPPDPTTSAAGTSTLFGVSFSSDSSDGDDDDEDDMDVEIEMEATENRKRKRGSHGGDEHSDGRMMEFFEGLLKQVMQKQEEMQQKFLEAIEKREQDRMIREEAWKRQDMARISREHDLMAQERALSTSRDAAIIAFLEKITGQTIHLPTAVAPPPPPPPPRPPPPSHRQPQQPQTDQREESRSMEIVVANQAKTSTDIVIVPQQDLTAGGSFEMNPSRWPKAEVLALIHLRSGMESKYQEAVPKGPLWEEISAGMQRMGYNRNAKRCKEKWENINKYFKKVKESNKKRPEDAKTCPYFHELDALYRKKILGSTSGIGGSSSGAPGGPSEPPQQDAGIQRLQSFPANVSVDKDGGTSEVQTTGGGAFSSTPFGEEKQPEDMLKKEMHGHDHKSGNSVDSDGEDNYEEEEEEEEEEDDDQEYDDKTEEEMKMVYKIQFQRPNNVRSSSTGGGTGGGGGGGGTPPSSFVAMVQ